MKRLRFYTTSFLFLLLSIPLVLATPPPILEELIAPIIVEDEGGNTIQDYILHVSITFPENSYYDYNWTEKNRKFLYLKGTGDLDMIWTLKVTTINKSSGIISLEQDYIDDMIDTNGTRYPLKIKFILDKTGSITPEIIETDLMIDLENCLADCKWKSSDWRLTSKTNHVTTLTYTISIMVILLIAFILISIILKLSKSKNK